MNHQVYRLRKWHKAQPAQKQDGPTNKQELKHVLVKESFPALGKTCENHFREKCPQRTSQKKAANRRRKVHTVDEYPKDEEFAWEVNSMGDRTVQKKIIAVMKMEKKHIEF